MEEKIRAIREGRAGRELLLVRLGQFGAATEIHVAGKEKDVCNSNRKEGKKTCHLSLGS